MNDGWVERGDMVVKEYIVGSFAEAIEFINDLAEIVESKRIDYPTITITKNKVSVALAKRSSVHTKLIDELYDINYSMTDEDVLLREQESKDKARLRSRGPYRKSSGIGKL
jgi:pterin-4a-carbinolamine dehydratase